MVGTTPFTELLGNGNNTVRLSSPVVMSFDPVVDALRVISPNYNLLVNADTGALAGTGSFTAVAFDSSDTNAGKTPCSPASPTRTRLPILPRPTPPLYALESTTASLVRVGDADVGTSDTSIDGGDLHTIGPLNAGLSSNGGFTIEQANSDGTAYAVLQQRRRRHPLHHRSGCGQRHATSARSATTPRTINALVISP